MSLKNEPLTFTKSQIRVLSFLFFLEKRGRRRKMKPTSVSRMKKFPFTHKQHLQWSSRASSLRSRIFYSSSYLSRTFPTSSSIPPLCSVTDLSTSPLQFNLSTAPPPWKVHSFLALFILLKFCLVAKNQRFFFCLNVVWLSRK